MTNSRTFILPTAGTWYNLWTLINAGIADKTFTTSPFVPNFVRDLNIQSALATTNVNNSGATLSVAYDGTQKTGVELLSGAGNAVSGNISLQSVWVKFDVNGASFNATFGTH